MEKALDMPTCLFGGPPDPDNLIKLGESQIGFISIFALPLFSCMSEILPPMGFTVRELSANMETWKKRIKGWMEPGGMEGVKGNLVAMDPSECPISAAMRQARLATTSASSSGSSTSSSLRNRSRQGTRAAGTVTQGQKYPETDTDTDDYTEAESEIEDDENEEEEYVSPRSSFGERSPPLPHEAGLASASASASVSSSASSSTSSTSTTTQKMSKQSSRSALRREAPATGGARSTTDAPAANDNKGFAFGLPVSSAVPAAAVGAAVAGGLAGARLAQQPSSSESMRDRRGERSQQDKIDPRLNGDDVSGIAQQQKHRELEHVSGADTANINVANDSNREDHMNSDPTSSYASPSDLMVLNGGRGNHQKMTNNLQPTMLAAPQTPTALSPSSAGIGSGTETASPDVSPRSTSSHIHAYAQQAQNEGNKSDSIVIDNNNVIYDTASFNGNGYTQADKQIKVEKEKYDRGGSVGNYSYPNPYAAQQSQQQQGHHQKSQSQSQSQAQSQQPQPHIANLLSSRSTVSDQSIKGRVSADERSREDLGDAQSHDEDSSQGQAVAKDQGLPQSRSPKVTRSLTPSSLYHQVLYGPGDGTVPTPAHVPATTRSAALTSHPSSPDTQQQQQQQRDAPTTPTKQQKRQSQHSSHHKILRRFPSAQDFKLRDGWSGFFSSSTSGYRNEKDRNSTIAPDAFAPSGMDSSDANAETGTKTTPNTEQIASGSGDPEDLRSTKTSSTFFPTPFHNPFASSPFSPFTQFVPHSSSLNDNNVTSVPNPSSLPNPNAPDVMPLPPTTPTTTTTPTRPTTSNTVKTVNTTKTNKTTSTSAGYNNSNGSSKPHKNVLQKKNPHYYPGMAVPLPPSTPTHSTFTTATSTTTSNGTSGSGSGFGFGFGVGSGFLNSVRRRQSAPGGSGGGNTAATAAAAAAVKNIGRERERGTDDSGKGGLTVQQQKMKGDDKSAGNGNGVAIAAGTGASEDGKSSSHGRRRFWRRARGDKSKEREPMSVQ